jgi:dienelactone hydrolase
VDRDESFSTALATQLAAASRVEHIAYPDAGHLFGIPNLPHTLHIYEYRNGSRLDMGGSLAADARASADAFPRVLRFLRANLCTEELTGESL